MAIIDIVRSSVEYALRALQFEPIVHAEVSFYEQDNLLAVATVSQITTKEAKVNFLNAALNLARKVRIHTNYQNSDMLKTTKVRVLNIYNNKSYNFERLTDGGYIVDYISRVNNKPSANSYDLFVAQIKFLSQDLNGKYTNDSVTTKIVEDEISSMQTIVKCDTNNNEKKVVNQSIKTKYERLTKVVNSEGTLHPSIQSVSMITPSAPQMSFIRLVNKGTVIPNITNINLFTLDYILFVLNFFQSISSYNVKSVHNIELNKAFDWADRLIRAYFKDSVVSKKTNHLGGISYDINSQDDDVLNRHLFYYNATYAKYRQDDTYSQSPDLQTSALTYVDLTGQQITVEEFLTISFSVDATKWISFWKGVAGKFKTKVSLPMFSEIPPYLEYAIGTLLLPTLFMGSLYNSRLKLILADPALSLKSPYDFWILAVMNINYHGNVNGLPAVKYIDSEDFTLSAGVTNFIYLPAIISDGAQCKELACVAACLSKSDKDGIKLTCFGDDSVYLQLKKNSPIYSASRNSYPEYLALMMSKRKVFFGVIGNRLDFSTAYKTADWQVANSYIISILSNIPVLLTYNSVNIVNNDYRTSPMANNLFSEIINRKPAVTILMEDVNITTSEHTDGDEHSEASEPTTMLDEESRETTPIIYKQSDDNVSNIAEERLEYDEFAGYTGQYESLTDEF